MNTWANNLFYIVFLGQILLTSYWIPKMILARMGAQLEKYPPSSHPKLYPKPIEYYRRGQAIFKWASRLVFLLGFVMLYGAWAFDHGTFADDGYISEAWPAAYGVIQFLPLMALEMVGFKQFKLMREANTSSTRRAVLRPRRLLDYINPGFLTLALVMFLGAIGFGLVANNYSLAWGTDALQRDLVMAATNGLLFGMGLWHLHGRKQDPYQATDDRTRQIRTQLSSLMLVSTALSVFLMFQTADDLFDLDYLDAPLMSLYFQACVLLSIGFVMRSLCEHNTDFDVYTNDASMEKN